MMDWAMRRGDIFWENLDATLGSEINKRRPCVLIGATPINKIRRTVVVIPLSSSPQERPPLSVSVTCLDKQAVAVCDQIRAIDKTRILGPAGQLSETDLKTLEAALKQVLSLL